jgi:hypothetical protein
MLWQLPSITIFTLVNSKCLSYIFKTSLASCCCSQSPRLDCCVHEMIKRRQFFRNIQVRDFIISTGGDRYMYLQYSWRFSKEGNAKKYIIIFDQLILIYRANIGKRAILCQNIRIIGHFQKDRDFIGNIGPLEGLIYILLVIYNCWTSPFRLVHDEIGRTSLNFENFIIQKALHWK